MSIKVLKKAAESTLVPIYEYLKANGATSAFVVDKELRVNGAHAELAKRLLEEFTAE